MIKNSAAYIEKITELSLLIIIFALPFSKSIIEIFFGVAIVSWFLHRIALRKSRADLINTLKPVNTHLNLPICIFTSISFLSMLTSVSFYLSLKGFFCKLLEGIFIYFITVEIIDDNKKLNRAIIVFFLSMILVSVDSIYQLVSGADFIRGYSKINAILQGPFDSQNKLAGWLIVVTPFVLSLAYSGKNILKKYTIFLLWVLTFVLTVLLFMTYSRGGWLALTIAFIFLGIFKGGEFLKGVIIIPMVLFVMASNFIQQRILSIGRFAEIDRIVLWKEAINIIRDFPFIGAGLNTYSIVAPMYKITDKGGVYPHNCYLHMAAEIGLLGLFAFVCIIVILFKTSLLNLKAIDNGFYKAIVTGLLAGLFGFLVHSFFDTDIYTLQLGNLMWIIMGLIVAVQNIALKEKP